MALGGVYVAFRGALAGEGQGVALGPLVSAASLVPSLGGALGVPLGCPGVSLQCLKVPLGCPQPLGVTLGCPKVPQGGFGGLWGVHRCSGGVLGSLQVP